MKSLFYILNLIVCLGHLSAWSQVSMGKTDIKCSGDKTGKATVLSVANATYPLKDFSWSNGVSGPTRKTLFNIGAGTYTVTVTDAHDCTGTGQVVIESPESPLNLDLTSSADEFYLCGTSSIIVVATPSGGTPPYTTNGDQGAYARRISLATFGNGPKYLDFETSDANGCKKKHRQFFAFSAIACASDPNDITGPTGIRTSRWVAAKDRMEYTIRFENDPVVATAPAQVVHVTMALDPDINPFALQLGDFGWGPFTFDIPEGSTYFQERLDLRDSIGLFVDVIAGYNVNNNEYFWFFESIDPNTGQVPIDPLLGFLPVNDTLTGSGEGFIHFSTAPRANTMTGDSISAQAEIIFDVNEAIVTNTWGNKLDAEPPVSVLHMIGDSSESTIVELNWTAADDPGGVGVREYELFAAVNGGSLELLEEELTDTFFIYEAEPGFQYGFVVLAIDSVGNREAMKDNAEDSIYIIPVRSIELLSPSVDNLCAFDLLTIRWHDVTTDTVRVEMSLDSGFQYTLLMDSLIADSLTIFLHDSMISAEVFLKLTDIHDNGVFRISQKIDIHALPVVDAGLNAGVCEGEYLFLAASGGNTFVWDSNATLNLLDVYNPRATPVAQTTYFVTGIDVFGCRDRDSVTLSILPVYLDSITHLMCNEDSVFAGGGYQTEPGFYTDELVTLDGCDSTVVTEVILTGPCPFPSPQVYVDKDALGLNNGTSWTDAFVDLQDALEAVGYYEDVHEIWMAEGVYVPTTTGDRNASFVLSDSVFIYGGFQGTEISRAERILDPSLVRLSGDIGATTDSTDNVYHVVQVDSTCLNCVLDGLTVTFGHADGVPAGSTIGAGLFIKGNVLLESLIIERNTTQMDGAAIYNTGAEAILTIRNCTFRLNFSGLERDILNSAGALIEFEGMNVLQD